MVTCHIIVIDSSPDTGFVMRLRNSLLSSYVLYVSMFVTSVHLFPLFMYVITVFLFFRVQFLDDMFHDVTCLVTYGVS